MQMQDKGDKRMKSHAFRMIAVVAALFWMSSPASAQQAAAPSNANTASIPTPMTPDGHPDLSGLWTGGAGGGGGAAGVDRDAYGAVGFDPEVLAARQSGDRTGDAGLINFERDNTLVRRMGSNKPPYKPQYWEIVKHLDQNGNSADSAGNCMPPGVPRVGPPAEIIQTPKQLIFLYLSAAASPAGYRAIPTDGRKHSNLEDLDGTWNGESIGHWEGDTMVIDTIGFNTATWLDIMGYMHSENMHVIERLHRDGNMMTWQVTVDDPDVFLHPWDMNPRTVRLNPDPAAIIPESPPCSERDYAHVVTKEHH
jgi:hypothetical protein